MPKLSDRAKLLEQLDQLIQMEVLEFDSSDDEEEAVAELEDLISLKALLTSRRNLNMPTVIPKNRSLRELLWQYPDGEFRQIVRMNKQSFARLVEAIENHGVFRNQSKHAQEEPCFQLMVVLSRLGCYGNGAAIGRNARMAGVSNGTVSKFTDRVFTALLGLHDNYIRWPNEHERRGISRRFASQYGLPGAVGVVDGTPINMEQKPHIDGEVYFSRKKSYCINLQLVCDDKKSIIYYQTGWPGSVGDSTVFDESDLCKQPELYFSDNQFLLADAGYGAKAFICTPYKQPQASIPHHRLFNQLFSTARVKIEHLNGLLKGRFSSLKGIRTQVKRIEDFDRINKWIVVCLVLHNIMVAFEDEDFSNDDIEVDGEEEVNNFIDVDNGNQLRLNVENTLLRWYHSRN